MPRRDVTGVNGMSLALGSSIRGHRVARRHGRLPENSIRRTSHDQDTHHHCRAGGHAGTALAQQVTVYGRVDLSMAQRAGQPDNLELRNGSGSRFGVRGVEDVGGGCAEVHGVETARSRGCFARQNDKPPHSLAAVLKSVRQSCSCVLLLPRALCTGYLCGLRSSLACAAATGSMHSTLPSCTRHSSTSTIWSSTPPSRPACRATTSPPTVGRSST